MAEWALFGYLLGKGKGQEDVVYVDKKKCTHTDCVNYNLQIKCTVQHCREHLTERHSPTQPQTLVTKEKETIVKEIVMIPCQYCGGLMSQTAVFCPNCGAKRNR